MEKNSKIFIAGHRGMVGSNIYSKLLNNGFQNLIIKNSDELDLRNQNSVNIFFEKYRPEYVFLCAAKVGGILANSKYKANFIYDNLMIECNIINASFVYGVKKLLFLGSSCIYPKNSNLPIKEESLLSGYLEKTNQPYAISKIAGIELCQSYKFQYGCNFISAMPTNLYGTNDNYDIENSHVIPALIRKISDAKDKKHESVTIWGSGKPKREFLHSSDLADACIFLMNNYNSEEIINIGTGIQISIKDLAIMICKIINFKGNLHFDLNMPDGTMEKVLDVTRINKLGWHYSIDLDHGLEMTINEYLNLKNK
jgi:GDP-L-fucose synthase